MTRYFQDFARTAGSSDFPCVFAPRALRRNQLLFGLGDVARGGWGTAAELMGQAAKAIWEDPDQAVVLWFEGVGSTCLEDDHEALRRILETLLEDGAQEWPPDAPRDPADPGWNFWYRGIDFFVNTSTRHHRLRRSRNLGACFTLVVQSRASFDRLPRQAAAARKAIRRRTASYDSVAVSPHLGTHGQLPELPQFFLGDTNGCPYLPVTEKDVVLPVRGGR